MSEPKDLQALLLHELERLFAPLISADNRVDQLRLLTELGWRVGGPDEPVVVTLCAAIGDLVALAQQIQDLIADPPQELDDIPRALEAIRSLFDAVHGLDDLIAGLRDQGEDLPEQLGDLGVDLVQHLIATWMMEEHPFVLDLLALVGLVDFPREHGLLPQPVVDGQGAVVGWTPTRPSLHVERLERLFTDPVGFWTERYLPASGRLVTPADVHHTASRLFPAIARLLRRLGLMARYGLPPGADLGDSTLVARDLLRVAYYASAHPPATFGGTFALDCEQRGGGLGLVITPFGSLGLTQRFGDWALSFSSNTQLPPFAVGPEGFTAPGFAAGQVGLGLELRRHADAQSGVALRIGGATGTRFEVGLIEASANLDADDAGVDAGAMLGLQDAALVIAGGDGDGFIAKILPQEGLRLGFNFGVGYSTGRGLHFSGGVSEDAALELTLPVDLDLFGVLQVEDVTLRIAPETSPPGLSVAASAVVHTQLGPLSATVEGMGLTAALTFPPGGGGNLGPAQLALGFKPPTGVALAVDATVVKGGGYLSFEQHRYTGVLQLALFEKITINAIGILTTQLPGGERGFSLFILISVVFDPGIQVGMGFSITGMGGLLGLNRGMNPQGLRAGVRDGRVGDVLFPVDPLKNAPAVIASIEGFFPVQKGRFVFGPVFRISWGTPAIINLEMGVILEVPAPARIALPGVLRMALPDPDDPVLQLNVAFLGLVDFGEKVISIDASIFDSRILSFTLSGDMAFRLRWGRNPYFLYSVGGFHPLFQPPEGLGLQGMRRLRVDILNTKQLKLGLETYFALTSNTVQLGARADFKAKMGVFQARAETGFDALFVFNPFHMDVSIWFLAALSAGDWELLAVSVDARLTGPTPWFFKGSATVNFLGEELDVAVEHSWGEEKDTRVEAADARAQLLQALEDGKNWQASSSGGSKSLSGRSEGVALRATAELAASGLVMPPGGTLQVSQQVLPLDRDLHKLGAAPIQGPRRFSLEGAALIAADGSAVPLASAPLTADFAPAQYSEMSEAEKLSAPSFEPMASGLSLDVAGGGLRFGGRRSRAQRVEQVLIDQDDRRLAASHTVAVGQLGAEEVAP